MQRNRERNEAFFKAGKGGGVVTDGRGNSNSALFRQARSTGVLILSNRELREIPKEVFDLEKDIQEGEKFWEMVPLSKLDLSFNRIANLPADLGKMATLVTLKARNNQISDCPYNCLEQCNNLVHLDLANNSIRSIPGELFPTTLPLLKEIFLFGNQLEMFPESVFYLPNLTTLHLQNNKISRFYNSGTRQNFAGSELSNLLQSINLSSNKLEELPIILTHLTSLQTLEVSGNKLKTIPNLKRLRNLVLLDLSVNAIEQFPSLPESPCSLDRIMLNNNRMSNLDIDALVECANITEIHLAGNMFKEIPEDIARLGKLKILDISNNDIADLPYTLGFCNSLQRIILDGLPIRTIRRTLLEAGATEALKKYLRTRKIDPDVNPNPNSSMRATASVSGSSGMSMSSTHVSSVFPTVKATASNVPPAASSGGARATKFNYGDDTRRQGDMKLEVLRERIRSACNNTLDLSNLSFGQLCNDTLSDNLLDQLTQSHVFDASTSKILISSLNLSTNELAFPPLPSLWTHMNGHLITLTLNDTFGAFILANRNFLNPQMGLGFSLPPSIKHLEVSGNRLTADHLEALISGLSNLDTLVAARNQIDRISGSIFSNFQRLRHLDVETNRISSLSSVDWSRLVKLECLIVSSNSITDVNCLCEASNTLTTLKIDNNSISEIPARLGRLNLKHFSIHGNPQRSITSSMMQQGTEAILKKLRERMSMT